MITLEQTNVETKKLGFTKGIALTLLIAIAAKYLAELPFLHIMGQLVIAILIGVVWKSLIGVPAFAVAGTNYSSKVLLRVGIILLGMRLNLKDIFNAGPKTFAVGAISLAFAILVVYGMTRIFKSREKARHIDSLRNGYLRSCCHPGNFLPNKSKGKRYSNSCSERLLFLGTTFTFGLYGPISIIGVIRSRIWCFFGCDTP